LARAVLEKSLSTARIDEASDALGAVRVLGRACDVAVVDRGAPGSSLAERVAALRAVRPETAIVLLFPEPRADEVLVALGAGASDVVPASAAGFLRLAAAVSAAHETTNRQRAIERDEMRLQTLLDRAGVGAFRATLDQRLIEASPAFLRLLGVETLAQALDLDLRALFPEDQDRAALLRRVDEHGELHARRIELRRADGSAIAVRLTETLLLDPDGDVVVDGLVEDVGAGGPGEQDLADRLQQAERSNADLRDFAYVASHELQEPLRAVERYAALVAEEGASKLSPGGREALGAVVEGTARMQALVDDLLALARVETEGRPFEPCDLNALVDRALRGLRRLVESTAAEVSRDDLPVVMADASQLQLLVHNLLHNALKFRGPEAPRIHVGCERRGEFVRVSVRDHGPGFEPAQAEAIFAMFKRLRPELPGTGMGLAICRRIVERHGGRIWAEATGDGAMFHFELPVLSKMSPRSGEGAGGGAVRSSARKATKGAP
jgi:PAS domain S-box-containing protein